MKKNLRTFLHELELQAPGEFLRVTDVVSARLGIPAYLYDMEKSGCFPAVLFEKVADAQNRNYRFPVISNLFAGRHRLALALGTAAESLADHMVKLEPIPSRAVNAADAPVKETVLTGASVDLDLLPVVTHHLGDAGAYITGASVWCKDIDTGDYNCAMLRLWAREKRLAGIHLNPHGHTYFHCRRWADRKKAMPVAICIGHHPSFYLGTQAKGKGNELDYIGGMMGEPLTVTASETLGADFLVPAEAEVVLEGEIPPDVFETEGPFGDFTGYTDPAKPHHVVKLSAMTFRRDAVFLDVFSGHRDHFLMDAPNIEANLLRQLQEAIPTVKKVFLPYSGCCRFHVYIQIRKTNDGQPRTAIYKALTSDFRLKHAIVVDDDIDIENEEAVWWAVATRSQWDNDIVVLPGVSGSVLDPSGDNGLTAKGGIDATVPLKKAFPPRNKVVEPQQRAHSPSRPGPAAGGTGLASESKNR